MKYKLLILLGVFLVSFSSIFVKLIDLQPSIIAMYRLAIGGLILLPFALREHSVKKMKFKEFKIFIIAGFTISIHYLSWFTALNFTSPTSSTLIICTQPLVALLFGFMLYRETITKSQFLLLIMALSGVSFVAYGDIKLGVDALIGDGLTFIAVILYVIYLLIGKQVVKSYSFVFYTAILFLSATLILFMYNLLMGYALVGYSMREWGFLFLIGVIPNAGQTIFNYTLRYVKPSLISTSILLEPIIVSVLAMIILNDKISTNQLIGGSILLISVYLYIRRDKLKKPSKKIPFTKLVNDSQ